MLLFVVNRQTLVMPHHWWHLLPILLDMCQAKRLLRARCYMRLGSS